jgi:AmmeMemoRadiSam system protein A
MTPLDTAAQGYLLGLARAAVEAAVRHQAAPDGNGAPESLRISTGVFVSVHRDGELRGCVGYVEPRWLIPETVARAGTAVVRDGRFDPLRPAELPDVEVEVSVLSRPTPIEAAAVEVGVHGLVLSFAGRSGLLLPQVPVEWAWDAPTFLEQLCRKAGLAEGTWRKPGAELRAFTAQRFSSSLPSVVDSSGQDDHHPAGDLEEKRVLAVLPVDQKPQSHEGDDD